MYITLSNPSPSVVILVAFLVANYITRRKYGWRFFQVSGYDVQQRQHFLRTIRYRIVVQIDFFANLLWHATLLYWAALAIGSGWKSEWALVALATLVCFVATTLCALLAYRREIAAYAYASLGIGIGHLLLSVAALALSTQLRIHELLPNADVRFLATVAPPALVARVVLIVSTVAWLRLSREHFAAQAARRRADAAADADRDTGPPFDDGRAAAQSNGWHSRCARRR